MLRFVGLVKIDDSLHAGIVTLRQVRRLERKVLSMPALAENKRHQASPSAKSLAYFEIGSSGVLVS